MKIALVHNPGAGHGRHSGDELQELLRSGGYEPVPIPAGRDLAEAVVAERVAFAVVAGGDGTIRGSALALAPTGVPIAPLPLGTANNIARSLGIRGPAGEIIRSWSVDRPRMIDLGIATGPWGRRGFLEGCGLGLVGRSISVIEEIDEATHREFSDPEDKLHRDLSVFIALVEEFVPIRTTVSLDAARTEDDFLLIEVMNIQHAGPRIQLTRVADPADGMLDVVVATAEDRERLRHSLKTSLAGRVPDPVLDNRKSREVRLAFSDADFRIDDEVVLSRHDGAGRGGRVEVTLSVVPAALRLIAPQVLDDGPA